MASFVVHNGHKKTRVVIRLYYVLELCNPMYWVQLLMQLGGFVQPPKEK